MRLPGTILQGILARAALSFLRIYLGGVFVLWSWLRLSEGSARTLSAGLIFWGGMLVGCTLVLGLFTRLAAAGALALILEVLLAQGGGPEIVLRAELAWACIAVAVLVGAAGRTFGLDSFLAERWPRSPFW